LKLRRLIMGCMVELGPMFADTAPVVEEQVLEDLDVDP
jgi:hypothetical protein